MGIPFLVFLAMVGAIVVFVIVACNRLMSLTQRSPASWSDMVARRSDLVFDVIESVKDYATHERDTLGAVVQVAGLRSPRGARRPAATSSWTALKERHVLTVSLGS